MTQAVGRPGSGGPELCVAAVVVDAGDLLMIRRGREPFRGAWSVPGGRVEPGETLAEAVVRELGEETGLEGVCEDLLGLVERIGTGYHQVILDYRVTLLERGAPRPGDDAAEAAWVPLPAVTDLDLPDGLAEFLHDHGILATIT